MRELRTQESEAFNRFFESVRESAKSQDCIFFVDCGEGRELLWDDIEGEDLSGWLIPINDADAFQNEFDKNEVASVWDRYYRFAIWETDGTHILIDFRDYTNQET